MRVQKKLVTILETNLKDAEGEASKLRTKMDNFLFGSVKSDQTLHTIQQKQTLM